MNSRINENVSKLFEYWCEISPSKPDEKVSGHIVESFPDSFKDSKVIADIAAFAFPCEFEKKTIQIHSFVLTNIDSKWRFGFCRHDPKSATAMVIITYLPWHDTFIKFLNVLAEIKKNPYHEFQPFLAEAYNNGVPEPGAYLKLHYDRSAQTFMFQRPSQFQLPSIPENHNLNLYYNFVEPKFMIGVFAAMLAERRIIFVSRRLDILSSCIQAANAFLYPMVWQHIFIPVLPMKMKDILGAPMPFLIGVPDGVYATLKRDEIGDVVILNCDKKTLETPFDDVKNMPQDLVASLKKQLSNPAEHRGDKVSKIFLGILVQLIGSYRDAVKFNNKITFDPDTFIESRPSHLRPFLTNMLQLQIFQQFIEERLDMLNTGQGFSDEFELENFRYAEKSGKKVKLLNKDFFRNVKDKTNPAVKSAVKSVKEGGRGMKTAYKGLRSKLRETTPPKSKLNNSQPAYDLGHQSAPNSPVFNKRPQTIALSEDSYHNHHIHQASTPSSTSLYNSPHIMMGNNHNNNIYSNDVRSPSLSPTSPNSNSSSEMNLLQELQQFALFKSPAVNRSLKPTCSFDNNRSSRTGAPLNPPPSCQSLSKIQEAADRRQKSSISVSSSMPTRFHTLSSNNNIYNSKDVCFDTSPDMPSPPVPPRRMQSAALALAAIQISPPPLSPPSSCSSNSSYSKYNNFNVHTNPQNQGSNCDLFSSSFTPNSSVDQCYQQPIPLAPKPMMRKESNPEDAGTKADHSKALINFEANSSFEIEDFDPLNENAKPIPHVPSFTKSATSSPPVTGLSFNNPIHPYFTPQHHHINHVPHKKPEIQDDIELLRNYGLDKFTLLDMPNGERKSLNMNSQGNCIVNNRFSSTQDPASSSTSRISNTGHNWTQFD